MVAASVFEYVDNTKGNAACAPEHARPLDILLVEDSLADAVLTRIVLDEVSVPYKMTVLQRGEQVLPYLLKKSQRLPDFILLDLGLPDICGFQILEDISALTPTIRSIPIFILTGIPDFAYITSLYKMPIPFYITKPIAPAHIDKILKYVRGGDSRMAMVSSV